MWEAKSVSVELIKELPKKPIKNADTSTKGSIGILPDGISHKQSHYARQLADNQDVVEQ